MRFCVALDAGTEDHLPFEMSTSLLRSIWFSRLMTIFFSDYWNACVLRFSFLYFFMLASTTLACSGFSVAGVIIELAGWPTCAMEFNLA